MRDLLFSVPVVFGVFLLFFGGLYLFFGRHAARGKDHPEKYLPYSGGQDIPPSEGRLSYQAFFRIGLLFGILHVAALVLATLPLKGAGQAIGLIYLAGISISAIVLAVVHTR